MSFFGSWHMLKALKLRFAITEEQKSVFTGSRLLSCSLVWLALGIGTIDSGSSYTGSIGWRITQTPSQPFSGSQLSLSEDQGYPWIHAVTGIQIAWIILHSFYISLFKCLVWSTTQCILWYYAQAQWLYFQFSDCE